MNRSVVHAPSRSATLGSECGYAMAALLVAMSVMAVMMTVALPVWNTAAKREKEAELVFRGEQYARAIALYQRKFANTLPPSVDVLVNDRYLRKRYKDPITGGDFQLLSGASVQANTGVPGGQVPGPGGTGRGATATGTGRGTGTGQQATGRQGSSAFGTSSFGTGAGTAAGRTGAAGSGFGLGAGVGAGAGGTVPGGVMGVTSTSKEQSLRLYNGRGVYNEWTFVAVQRNLNAGAGGENALTPGGTGGRAGQGGRGSATPGRGAGPQRGTGPQRPGGFGTGGMSTPRPGAGGFDR